MSITHLCIKKHIKKFLLTKRKKFFDVFFVRLTMCYRIFVLLIYGYVVIALRVAGCGLRVAGCGLRKSIVSFFSCQYVYQAEQPLSSKIRFRNTIQNIHVHSETVPEAPWMLDSFPFLFGS